MPDMSTCLDRHNLLFLNYEIVFVVLQGEKHLLILTCCLYQ